MLYKSDMAIETSYSDARARLAELLDRVINDREIVRIRRRGCDEDVVMVAAHEFDGLEETVHLLRSPRNAERLLAALEQSRRGEGIVMTFEELCRGVGVDPEEV